MTTVATSSVYGANSTWCSIGMSFMYMLNRTRDTTLSHSSLHATNELIWLSSYSSMLSVLGTKLLVMQQLILSNFVYDPSEYNLLEQLPVISNESAGQRNDGNVGSIHVFSMQIM